MKLVLLSSLGAVHLHVAAEIARRFPSVTVLRPYREVAPPTVDERLARVMKKPVGALRDGMERRLSERRVDRSEQAIARLLFPSGAPFVPSEDVAIRDLHSPRTIARLRELSPDVMLVSGAPLLRPELFTLPRLGTVNVHYGVAPDYRGEDTLFWAMSRGDHKRLGVTIHTVDRGVDTGRILAQGFPQRRGGESEDELLASSARLGARLAIEVLTRLAKGQVQGTPQPPGGRQYFRRERTAMSDARHAFSRALGRTPPAAPERVIYY